ncbi:MAG TPA: helix-turn-helix domain-containing protein [Bacteroidales bacterium]|nr:helix-turn-helix domain-containing protein [Bacteroidales bacterium]
MFYKVFSPPPFLKPFIHSIQVMEVSKSVNSGGHKIVPYGFAGLIMHYKDPCLQTDRVNGTRLLPRIFIAGLTDQPVIIEGLGNIGTIAVNFYPSGLYHFLKTPSHELINVSVDACHLLGPGTERLIDDIQSITDIINKVKRVNHFLVERFTYSVIRRNMQIEYAQKKIISSGGDVNITDLAASAGISLSSLERNFRKQTGFTPKYYAKIMRFNHVFRLLQSGKSTSWQDIVYECGYYDQAHLIREFSTFTGETPGEFFSNTHLSVSFYSGKHANL